VDWQVVVFYAGLLSLLLLSALGGVILGEHLAEERLAACRVPVPRVAPPLPPRSVRSP
jgi:hypothetical protein